MGRRLFDRLEHTSRVNHVEGTALRPWDVAWVLLGIHVNRAAVHHELAVTGTHLTIETAVCRVILEHVHHVVEVNEGVVHCHHIRVRVVKRVAEDNTANTTKSVDTHVHHYVCQSTSGCWLCASFRAPAPRIYLGPLPLPRARAEFADREHLFDESEFTSHRVISRTFDVRSTTRHPLIFPQARAGTSARSPTTPLPPPPQGPRCNAHYTC